MAVNIKSELEIKEEPNESTDFEYLDCNSIENKYQASTFRADITVDVGLQDAASVKTENKAHESLIEDNDRVVMIEFDISKEEIEDVDPLSTLNSDVGGFDVSLDQKFHQSRYESTYPEVLNNKPKETVKNKFMNTEINFNEGRKRSLNSLKIENKPKTINLKENEGNAICPMETDCSQEEGVIPNVFSSSLYDSQTESVKDLNDHLLPSSKKLFKCADCDYSCNRKSSLKTHTLTHSNTKLFNCPSCDYSCNHRCNLRDHLATHSNTRKFKCTECDYACKQQSNLKTHLLVHSNAKYFTCPECDYSTNRKYTLKQHLLTHSGVKFRCSECDYSCNHKSSLKIHSLTHSTTKLLKCSECDFSCDQKPVFRRHLLTHSGTKIFKCSECDFSCERERSLKFHSLIHSNTKLFQCSECDYASNRKGSLVRHALTHSDAKMFHCSFCNYTCNHKQTLKRHLLTHSN